MKFLHCKLHSDGVAHAHTIFHTCQTYRSVISSGVARGASLGGAKTGVAMGRRGQKDVARMRGAPKSVEPGLVRLFFN